MFVENFLISYYSHTVFLCIYGTFFRRLILRLENQKLVMPRFDFVKRSRYSLNTVRGLGLLVGNYALKEMVWMLNNAECAYGFRYVEMNGRAIGAHDNPDYDPWSVRQTAVYQQYDSSRKRITFLLISPSHTTKSLSQMEIRRLDDDGTPPNPFEFHRTILFSLYENWRTYIRDIERGLMLQVRSNTISSYLRAIGLRTSLYSLSPIKPR
jgi:hypothetical protein